MPKHRRSPGTPSGASRRRPSGSWLREGGLAAGTGPPEGAERHPLEHGAEAQPPRPRAEAAPRRRVLDLVDGLPRADEGPERAALPILEALLDNSEVEGADELAHLRGVVLEAHGEPAPVSLPC